MAVHVGHTGRSHEQIAVGLLMLDQPLEPTANRLLVLALDRVNEPGLNSGNKASPVAAVSELVAFCGAWRALAAILEVQAPRPVFALVPHDPVEPVFDRLLGLGAAPFGAHQLGARGPERPEKGAERTTSPGWAIARSSWPSLCPLSMSQARPTGLPDRRVLGKRGKVRLTGRLDPAVPGLEADRWRVQFCSLVNGSPDRFAGSQRRRPRQVRFPMAVKSGPGAGAAGTG